MKGPAEKELEVVSLNFDYIFKWNRILLRYLGIWPLKIEEPSMFESFAATFSTFMLAIVIATQWADLVVIWGQFDPMVDNLSATLGISLSIVKLVIVRLNFQTFQHCFDQVRKDWCDDHTEEYLQAMLRRARVGRIFSIASPGFAIGTAISYSILPLTLERPENSTDIFPPFPLRAAYFFDPTPTPIYQIIYVVQTSACYTSAIANSATDSFFAALALHACGQFDIVGQKLRAIDSKAPMIRDLVERHLQLIKFVETLENFFPSIILGQLIVSSLAICGIGYKFIMSLNNGSLGEMATFSIYLIAMLMIIYLYCYAGQCLIDVSTRLSEAAYDCKWYEMNPSDAKSILLIQLRAQKPLNITAANFVIMSHACFADVRILKALIVNCAGFFYFEWGQKTGMLISNQIHILSRSATYLSVLRAVEASI